MAEGWRMDGRVVLVTGAARGLGASYARCLAELGAHVVVNDLGVAIDGRGRSEAPAAEAAAAIRDQGFSASPDASDVGDAGEATAMIERVVAAHGRIDAVVNNAGNFLLPQSFEDTAFADFESIWLSHLGGTFNVCRAALPNMKGAGAGRIVNTVSTQALYGNAASVSYASAKGAVLGLTLSLAASVRGSDVAVNAISPGAFTRMVDITERPPEFTAALKRNLDPDLVAPLVGWLCHPDCRENGAIFQAMAGYFGRVVIEDAAPTWNFAPDVAFVAGAFPPVEPGFDSSGHAGRIMREADAQRLAAGA